MARLKRNPDVEYVPFTLRLPKKMKDLIEERASRNFRSASQEAEFLLQFALQSQAEKEHDLTNK
jgi:hypothetical protein